MIYNPSLDSPIFWEKAKVDCTQWHVQQTASQNRRDKCRWQPKQQLCDKAACEALRHKQAKMNFEKFRVISAIKLSFEAFQTRCIMGWKGYSTQSHSLAMKNISHQAPAICLYLIHPIWIHTTLQIHGIFQNTPRTVAGLTQFETAHQEGLLFASTISRCMCERQGSCTVADIIHHSTARTRIPTHTLCDTEPLCLLNPTAFATITPQTVRCRVPTGRTKVLSRHSAQCWWQGYGCYHGGVVG